MLLAAGVPAQTPTSGPDVTILDLTDTSNYGAASGYRGYSIGSNACNVGDQPVNWCNNGGGCGPLTDDQHPVIAQGIYRLKSGRFEQIGMSWLMHGFLSTNSPNSACQTGHPSCTTPPLGGDQLGVGCTNTYGSGLNGSTPLGQRSEVDATTGVFPYPYSQVFPSNVVEQRVKVLESDLAAASNPGALYWVEAQYVADNDAVAGNGFNNASYRAVNVQATSPFNLSFPGSTIREKSALRVWKVQDPLVELVNVDIPGSIPAERFEVARRVTNPSPGLWHFEYAIRNMNSDRSAQAFEIDFPDGTLFSGIGFKDIDHHSGEPYSTADWTNNVDEPNSVISWATDPFSTDPNANALRFATMFNFWFDADSPADEIHRLTFFKPGSPEYVDFAAPPISVAKTETSIGPYVVGDTISFDIAATNDCNVTLHSVVATDLSAVVGGCTPAQPSTLAPAEVMICPATHVVTQADVDAGSYTNSATGDSTETAASTSSVTVTFTADPAISVAKSEASTGPYLVGATISYNISVTNTGNITLHSVVATDPGAVVGVCTPAQPSTLAPEAEMNCPATHVVTQADIDAGSYSNTATGDSTETLPLGSSVTVILARADVSITKTDGATTEIPGTPVTYTIVASNAGPDAAPGVTVADSFSGTLSGCSTTCTGAGGGNCTAGPVLGNLNDSASLPVGGSVTYTATCDIASNATGPLLNTATVTVGAGVTDPNTTNNSSTDTDTLAREADLAITKTDGVTAVAPGDNTTYAIVASNNGPSDAPATAVIDFFPSQCTGVTWTCAGAGGATCSAGSSGNINESVNLPAGGSVSYSAVCTVSGTATGTLSNTAGVSVGVNDPNPVNNSATDVDSIGLVDLFSDGFETGDASRWSNSVPLAFGVFKSLAVAPGDSAMTFD